MKNQTTIGCAREQWRVVRTLITYEFNHLAGPTGLGFLLTLLEPVFHLFAIALWHYLVRVQPIYGNSKVLFLASGLYPIFVYIHVSTHARRAARQGSRNRSFPIARPIDFLAAECILKSFAEVLAGVVLFAGIFFWITPQAYPFNILSIVEVMAAIVAMGFGTSMINLGIETFFPPWRFIFGPISRGLALFSGVLFVTDYNVPILLRTLMSWNPLTHIVTLFRLGFYPRYPTLTFSRSFLWEVVVVSVILGIAIERTTRSYLKRSQDESSFWQGLVGE